MPCPEVVAVIASARLAGIGAEIGEVRSSIGGVVVMIARSGACPSFMPTPRRLVAVPKVLNCAFGVRVVTCCEYGTLEMIEQSRSGSGSSKKPLGPYHPTHGNIASPNEYWVTLSDCQ